MPLALTDAQLAQLTNACRPLQPLERSAFLAALDVLLADRSGELGEGEWFRMLKDLQREHFRAPVSTEQSQPRQLRRFG
jgi:hypothetical protein